MKTCIRCTVEDYEQNPIDDNGFCAHCLCDYINEAKTFIKSHPEITDTDIFMAEFAAHQIKKLKESYILGRGVFNEQRI